MIKMESYLTEIEENKKLTPEEMIKLDNAKKRCRERIGQSGNSSIYQ